MRGGVIAALASPSSPTAAVFPTQRPDIFFLGGCAPQTPALRCGRFANRPTGNHAASPLGPSLRRDDDVWFQASPTWMVTVPRASLRNRTFVRPAPSMRSASSVAERKASMDEGRYV